MDPDVIGVVLGALGGAAIGTERQWSRHASGPHGHFAGIRTCTLLGGLASLAGVFWKQGYAALAMILVGGAVGLIVAAYVAASRRDVDGTTEVATLVVVATGLLAGLGYWQLSSGVVATTALLLVEKSRLHELVEEIPDVGLRATFRFALMALVILPLLPEGPYGPLGSIRPRQVWMLVLFFSGLNYLAYVVRSFLGPSRGYLWTGVLGGMISSTNVTLSFARLSRKKNEPGAALALGVVAACTVLYVRVVAAASVLNWDMGMAILPMFVFPLLVGVAVLWWGFRHEPPQKTAEEEEPLNPLQLRSALQMGVLFQLVLFLMTAARDHFSQAGLIASGAVLGVTDVDSLVISMAHVVAGDQLVTAAIATVAGTISNTILKLGIAAVIGEGPFRKYAVVGLVVLAVATALPLIWFI